MMSLPATASSRWSRTLRTGLVHKFAAELDDGGRFSVNRYFIEGGLSYLARYDRAVSFSVGYGRGDYRFFRLSLLIPWNKVDSYRAGIIARWGGGRWMVSVCCALRPVMRGTRGEFA